MLWKCSFCIGEHCNSVPSARRYLATGRKMKSLDLSRTHIRSRRTYVGSLTYIYLLTVEPSYQVVWIYVSWKQNNWNMLSVFFATTFLQSQMILISLWKTFIWKYVLWKKRLNRFDIQTHIYGWEVRKGITLVNDCIHRYRWTGCGISRFWL